MLPTTICTFDFAPSTLQPRLCTFDFAPSTLHLRLCTLDFAPSTLHLRLCTFDFAPSTLHPRLCTFDFAPSSLHPRLCTFDFAPSTLGSCITTPCRFPEPPPNNGLSHFRLRIRHFRMILSGGAKARMTELEGERLQTVVRSLRTTACTRTRSNSTVRAFAPSKKMRGISMI